MKRIVTHIAMMLCIGASGQHMPGGIGVPCVWNSANKQISAADTLPSGTLEFSSFQVIVPTADAEDATLTSGQIVVTSRRLAELDSGQYINFSGDAIVNVPRIIATRRRLTESDTSSITITNLPLSASADSICESIIYSRMLSNRERQRVDTYLALKYGVTLDQTAPSSYVSSDGRVVWDAVTNATHSHHMVGICNDTISHLYQTTATNAESAELLRLTTDSIAPMSYVICGDDNNALKYIREEEKPKRLGRTWKVTTTGIVPQRMNLEFDTERIEEAFPLEEGEHYWLAINDSTYKRSADLGSLKAAFNDIAVTNGMTFTIVAAKGEEQPEVDESQTAKSSIYAVSVAPNPTTDGHVRLRLRLREEATVRVTLSGMDGHQYATQSRSGSDYYAITITLPSQGVWIATVESGESRQSYKLISK